MYPYELRHSAARIQNKLVHLCYLLCTFNVSPFIDLGKAVLVWEVTLRLGTCDK